MKRDDLIEYSLKIRHSEETGKKIRNKIWKIAGFLSLITVVEVILGAFIGQNSSLWPAVKVAFIIMTVLKAAYIILEFMHLGGERRFLRLVVLLPYIAYAIFFIFILIYEGCY